MKKVITKIWGIGLIIVLLSALFVAAVPAQAQFPLNWEMNLTWFFTQAANSEIIDYDVGSDGMTIYAITRTYAGCTCVVTEALVAGGDGDDETFTFDYVNENGIAARQGNITIENDAAVDDPALVFTLQGNDVGIKDVTDVAAVASDEAAGTFEIRGTDGTVLYELQLENPGVDTETDGVVNPGVDALQQSLAAGYGPWSDITDRVDDFLDDFDYVDISPDDPTVAIVGDADLDGAGRGIAITVNNGASFSSMGIMSEGDGANPAANLEGIAISPLVTGGSRFIVGYGDGGANLPGLYYYNYGPGVGAWRNACVQDVANDFVGDPDDGTGGGNYDNVVAFEFSSSFPSDWFGVAILEEEDGANDVVDYHILSFNSRTWDANIAAGYPVEIAVIGNAAGVVNSADLALLPEYDGGDDALRIGFSGLSIDDGGVAGGLWRHIDSAPATQVVGAVNAVDIYSVAFDGTNVAAGGFATNDVWRSADPLSTNPTFLTGRNLKEIGINSDDNDMTDVMFAGETLYGAKRGAASALSKSMDYGLTFNDYTLLDSGNLVFDDLYYTETGATWYASARDDITSSVYRVSSFVMDRVLTVAGDGNDPNFILRGVPSEPDVVYAGDLGDQLLFYSPNGGTNRWYQRNNVPADIVDMAIPSAEQVYIANGINVFGSSNSGFVWGAPMNTGLIGQTVNRLISVGEDGLVVGGTVGGLNYSTDGGATWTATMGRPFGPDLQVAASGLGDGDYLFAASEDGTEAWRCELGAGNPFGVLQDMNAPAQVGAEVNTGLLYWNGVLYKLASDAGANDTYLTRTSVPTIAGDHLGLFWSGSWVEDGDFRNAPTALYASAGSTNLYAIDSDIPLVYYFMDTVVDSPVTLIGPADGAQVPVNSISGVVNDVNFTWNRVSLATNYWLFIALDPLFLENAGVGGSGAVANDGAVVSVLGDGNDLQPGRTYYWRVAATAPLSSAPSETRTFTVAPGVATVPSIGAPANGGTVTTGTPAFSWTPVSQATLYQFQLSDDPSFATTLADETLAGTGIVSPVPLAPGTYFWRVKAIAPIEGEWSAIANVIVAEPAPPPSPPVEIVQQPAPEIVVETPPPPPDIIIPSAPETKEIAPAYIWAIIIIGAILVIAVIVLIVRTRRQV